MKAQTLTIQFPVPVELPDDVQERLHQIALDTCAIYEKANPDRVMWPMMTGFPNDEWDRYLVSCHEREDIHGKNKNPPTADASSTERLG